MTYNVNTMDQFVLQDIDEVYNGRDDLTRCNCRLQTLASQDVKVLQDVSACYDADLV